MTPTLIPTVMTTAELVEGFLAGTLPKHLWTHEAHLRVGLWHRRQFPPDEALRRMRDAIRTYNVHVGRENTSESGYHETLTRFYMWQLGAFLDHHHATTAANDDAPDAARPRPADAERELEEALMRECGDRALPLRHWSRERLMSPEARLGWLEPDLLALS